MSEGLPKVNVAPAVAVPIAAATQGVQAVSKLAEKHKDKLAKVSELSNHPVYLLVTQQKEAVLAVLGLILTFHGAQFKNIVLCTQLVITFLWSRFKDSVGTIYDDLAKVAAKAEADAPEPKKEDAAEVDDSKSKHAKKREAKKAEKDKVVAPVDATVHVEALKKMLKALDSERLTSATKEVLLCLMACLLVIHGGLAQHVVVAHMLVGFWAQLAEKYLHFEGFDDIQPWTLLMVNFVLWLVMLPLSLIASDLALVLNCALAGAQLATKRGATYLAAAQKLEDAEAFLNSPKGLASLAGLCGAGFLWQVWSMAAGGGLYWVLWILYLPAVIVEAILGCL